MLFILDVKQIVGGPRGIRTPEIAVQRQQFPTSLSAQNGISNGIRTRIPTVKGWCPNH